MNPSKSAAVRLEFKEEAVMRSCRLARRDRRGHRGELVCDLDTGVCLSLGFSGTAGSFLSGGLE